MENEIEVTHASGVKCPRCWHWHAADLNFDNLCNRCVQIILTDFPNHESAARILQNLSERGLSAGKNPAKTQ